VEPQDPPRICVLGSLNVDYFTKVKKLPTPGQTVAASALEIRFGGKGANQAIAASRQGALVSMIGRAGQDDMGEAYLGRLSKEGLVTDGIEQVRIATGSAFITVDSEGENTIVVAPGANGSIKPASIDEQRERIESAHALLVQFETPIDAVLRAIEIANEAGVLVFVNPSPFRADFPWSTTKIDYLIVNDGEAEKIDSALGPHQQLLARNLIITRGALPTLAFTEDGDLEVPSIEVTPIDTVGAGDAFAGTLATRVAGGEELAEAIRHANIAGALTTLKLGAQEAIPRKDEVERQAG
jgi:ribokinase